MGRIHVDLLGASRCSGLRSHSHPFGAELAFSGPRSPRLPYSLTAARSQSSASPASRDSHRGRGSQRSRSPPGRAPQSSGSPAASRASRPRPGSAAPRGKRRRFLGAPGRRLRSLRMLRATSRSVLPWAQRLAGVRGPGLGQCGRWGPRPPELQGAEPRSTATPEPPALASSPRALRVCERMNSTCGLLAFASDECRRVCGRAPSGSGFIASRGDWVSKNL